MPIRPELSFEDELLGSTTGTRLLSLATFNAKLTPTNRDLHILSKFEDTLSVLSIGKIEEDSPMPKNEGSQFRTKTVAIWRGFSEQRANGVLGDIIRNILHNQRS
jgi:hypothetical protein